MTTTLDKRRPWQGISWAALPKWQRLCCVLDERGPQTTGVLGHIRGIGENVRGIRQEADRHLRALGFRIVSEKTTARDARGKPIQNATYRLVDTMLAPLLERSSTRIEMLRDGLAGRPPGFDPGNAGSSPAPAAKTRRVQVGNAARMVAVPIEDDRQPKLPV